MAGKSKLFQASFAQGEVSDFIENRPDFGKRYNGARTVENAWLLPEGGWYRRPGLRWIANVKDSSKFTLLMPFEFSITDAFIIEMGESYIRFIKNRAQIMDGGSPYEIVGPYSESDLRDLHHEQSADFLFITSLNAAIDIQKLARVTDTNWTIANFNADPPPSYDADETFSESIAPNANTGTGIKFRVGADLFLAGDANRILVAGVGRGLITAVDNARQVTVNVFDAFTAAITASGKTLTSVGATVTSTGHGRSAGDFVILTAGAQSEEIRKILSIGGVDTFTISAAFSVDQAAPVSYDWIVGFAAGAWGLRLAPQTTLDVNKKEPVGTQVTLVAGAAAFRSAYVGKFIKMLGGTIKVTGFTNTTNMTGEIKSVLSNSTTDDPAAVAAGAWRLQEASWSATRGRPRTVAIHQGRLLFAGTPSQPTVFWGASLNDIFNFATGALANDAYEYTLEGGGQNPIQWLISLIALYIGDAKREYSAKGQGIDAPIGGEENPFVAKISDYGSLHTRPVVIDNTIVMLQRFGGDVVVLAYNINDSPDASTFVGSEITLFARQIREMGFAVHQPIYAQKPDSIVFMPLNNGQLAGLTFKARQEIQGFHRTKTTGVIESGASVPSQDGKSVDVYVAVQRTINGATVRSIEVFDTTLNTDMAKTGSILAGATEITGITHLAGETADVLIGGTYIGPKAVSAAGVVTLDANESPAADTTYEVGLHYDTTVTTLRPNIPGEVTEGLKRHWPIVFVRLKNTIGGKLNGLPLKPESGERPFTGLAKMENLETADPYDGALTIVQDSPYPMTVLGISGKVSFADDFT